MLKKQMLEVGFALIREYGVTHASVDKVTESVGIGRTTFYNFFTTKEQFLVEVMQYQREKGKSYLLQILKGREKMTVPEAKEYLRYLMTGEETIYQYMTVEESDHISKTIPDAFLPNLEKETRTINGIVSHMEGVKENLEYGIIANLMKTLAVMQTEKEVFHEKEFRKTLDAVLELLFFYIFKEEK
ncbi:MAG: TetR/AcrR family transcriptional regulator [Anaerotignum sp.]|nr:TetR/AcrR family transcriptional regulator [Anaerotignum sp.]